MFVFCWLINYCSLAVQHRATMCSTAEHAAVTPIFQVLRLGLKLQVRFTVIPQNTLRYTAVCFAVYRKVGFFCGYRSVFYGCCAMCAVHAALYGCP